MKINFSLTFFSKLKDEEHSAALMAKTLFAPFGSLTPYGDPTWYQGWHSPYYNGMLTCAVRGVCHCTPHSQISQQIPTYN
jgi:hypothetical protein